MEKREKPTVGEHIRFRALYINQRVVNSNHEAGYRCLLTDRNLLDVEHPLVLRSISSITSHEITDIADKVFGIDGFHSSQAYIKHFKDELIKLLTNTDIVDQLRGRGFAISFMGKSVEELISNNFLVIQHEK